MGNCTEKNHSLGLDLQCIKFNTPSSNSRMGQMYEQFRKSQSIWVSVSFFVCSPMWTCNELSVNAVIVKSNIVLQTTCMDRMNPNKMRSNMKVKAEVLLLVKLSSRLPKKKKKV